MNHSFSRFTQGFITNTTYLVSNSVAQRCHGMVDILFWLSIWLLFGFVLMALMAHMQANPYVAHFLHQFLWPNMVLFVVFSNEGIPCLVLLPSSEQFMKLDASVRLHAQPLTNKIRGAFCPPFNLLSAHYYGCLFYSILLFSHWMLPFMLLHHLMFNAKICGVVL